MDYYIVLWLWTYPKWMVDVKDVLLEACTEAVLSAL